MIVGISSLLRRYPVRDIKPAMAASQSNAGALAAKFGI
jgi:hypothetical protein